MGGGITLARLRREGLTILRVAHFGFSCSHAVSASLSKKYDQLKLFRLSTSLPDTCPLINPPDDIVYNYKNRSHGHDLK